MLLTRRACHYREACQDTVESSENRSFEVFPGILVCFFMGLLSSGVVQKPVQKKNVEGFVSTLTGPSETK